MNEAVQFEAGAEVMLTARAASLYHWLDVDERFVVKVTLPNEFQVKVVVLNSEEREVVFYNSDLIKVPQRSHAHRESIDE